MPGSFSERPERASENTGSPSYKHPHGISFLGWPRPPADLAGGATPCRHGGLADIRRWPMLPPGTRRRWQVEILISLDAIDPPQLRGFRSGSAPGARKTRSFALPAGSACCGPSTR